MKDYKIDLHVHSPASIDYMGGSGPKAFKDLLSAYAEQSVDLIALTDHNTIQGYIDYCKYRDQSQQVYELMVDRDESPELVAQLRSEVESYKRVVVLAGVEISVYPGVHIILIFAESVVERVSGFLRDVVGLGDAVKTGDPAKVSQLSAVAVLDKAKEQFNDDFFCVLPHVESAKGAWKELSGQSRADLFKHDSVLAIQFLNPDTRGHIKKALNNSEYKRSAPFKYIQASDYHGSPSVLPAQQYSIIESNSPLSWEKLRDALNGDAEVRSSCEFVEQRLEKFLNGKRQLQIEFQNSMAINDDRKADLMRMLSALLNTPSCTLRLNLFNTSETKERGSDAVAEMIKNLTSELDPPDLFEFEINQFHDSDTRQRFCVEVPKNARIRLWENMAWIAGADGIARPAKAWEIERQVSESFYSRYGRTKQRALMNSANELLMISNAFPAFAIATRLDTVLSKKRLPSFEAVLEQTTTLINKKESESNPNGFATGNHYEVSRNAGLKGGRLGEQNDYYRYSTPLFRQNGESDDKFYQVAEPLVIVTWDGAVTFCDEFLPLYSSIPFFVIKSKEEDIELKRGMLLGLTAYLKSSFVLWYILTIHQCDDLFSAMLGAKRLPLPSDVAWMSKLAVYSKNIILAENSFLQKLEEAPKTKEEKLANSKKVEKHNGSVIENICATEREIYRHLGFNSDEVKEVHRVLKELDFYDYGIGGSMPDFLDDLFGGKKSE